MDFKPIHFMLAVIIVLVFYAIFVASCKTESEPPAGPKPSLMIQSV